MTTTTKAVIGAVCVAVVIAVVTWSRRPEGTAEPYGRQGPEANPVRTHSSATDPNPRSGSAPRYRNPFQAPRLSDAERQILTADPAAALAADPDNLDLLVAWAAVDPDAALAWINARKDSSQSRASLLGAVAAGVFIKGGADALDQFVAKHITDPGLPPKYQNREDLLSHAMICLARGDSADAAMKYLTELRGRAPARDDAGDATLATGKLASSLVLGTKGGAEDQARAIDYLEAKGIGVTLDYWAFQAAFDADPRYWADWAWKRDSDLLTDIVQAWHREHADEARAWIADRLPPADPRRSDIEDRIKP